MSASAEHADGRDPALMAKLAGKYLTFVLRNEEYGVSVLKVREIIKAMPPVPVPQVPPHVRGVINLRGKIIPVADLRLKFGLETTETTERTAIIVVEIASPDGARLVGIQVDEVSEVLNISTTETDVMPEFGEGIATTYMLGVAKVKGAVKFLLDIDRVFSFDAVLNAA